MSNYERIAESLRKEFDEIKGGTYSENETIDLSDICTFVKEHVSIPHKKWIPPTQRSEEEQWFYKRPYLTQIYRDESPRIIIPKGRQMEISEMAVNWLTYWALKRRGTYIYASSTGQKTSIFSKDRLREQLIASPDLKPYITERPQVHRVKLDDSEIYLYSAFKDAKTLQGIAADGMILDEFQELAGDGLAIAEQCLTRSSFNRLIAIGNPELMGQPFHLYWKDSDMKEWDKERQIWIPTNQASNIKWSGYHISQEMGVGLWLSEEYIETQRLKMPKQEFHNHVLGEFYKGLQRPQTQEILYALFDKNIPQNDFKAGDELFASCDWGVNKTAHTIFWLMKPVAIGGGEVCRTTIYVERIEDSDILKHSERVIELCKKYPIKMLVADIGAGHIHNQQIFKAIGDRLINCAFVTKPTDPLNIIPTAWGREAKVDRTWALDTSLDYLVRPNRVKFYNEVDEAFKEFIVNDFMAEYPEVNALGRKEWTHAKDSTDDCLMAYTYSNLAYDIYRKQYLGAKVSDYLGFV